MTNQVREAKTSPEGNRDNEGSEGRTRAHKRSIKVVRGPGETKSSQGKEGTDLCWVD